MTTTVDATPTTDSTDATDRVLMVSSDGHATARMPEYRPYLPPALRDDFDEFLKRYAKEGARINEPASMKNSFDKEFVELWEREVIAKDRLEGTWDVDARFEEMARGGLAAEVIFPDFGIPFELYSKFIAALNNYRLTHEQRVGSYFAYNRWLVDFMSPAPHRFVGIALIDFDDVEAALAEIKWARESGFKGILLPNFGSEHPVFSPKFDPIWDLCEELGMAINSHAAISGTFEFGMLPTSIDEQFPGPTPIPHPTVMAPIIQKAVFYSQHQLLMHFIWGGILEKHPKLQFVMTEAGSAWAAGAIKSMDYTYEGAFTHSEVKQFLPHKPSEYWRRQCHLGSSVFSRAEMENRHEIGVEQITIGMDFPHPEGSWGMGPGHLEYLNATLGAARVTPHDARLMLGENAVKLWDLDRDKLQGIADETGYTMDEILAEPDGDHFPKGDVNKPFGDPR